MTRVARCRCCRKEVDEGTRVLSIMEFGAVFCNLACWRSWAQAKARAEHAEEEGGE